ncbi:MAG: type II secretion system F family protein [Bacillota bacterium]
MNTLIYPILFFINLTFLILIVYNILTKKNLKEKRLQRYFDKRKRNPKEKKTPIKEFLTKNLKKIDFSSKFKERIENNLLKANVNLTFEEYIILKVLVLITFMIIFIFLKKYILAFIFSIIIWILPKFFLNFLYKKRVKKFNNQLSDGIRILSNGLKAGYSYMQAIKTLTKEMSDPISQEFNWLLKEMSLGVNLKQALTNLDKRVDSEDLNLVIRAMIIQQETGGNLAEILDNISDTIRKRIKIQGEIKTLTAQGKMSGIVIGVMPIIIVFFLFVLNPSYANILIETKIGNILIGVSVISELIGIFFIKKIISIDF